MDTTQRTIEGAAHAPLSGEQKKTLAMAARKAYDAQVSLGLADGPFDDWRHAAVWEHLRVAGFRQMTQRGYGTMLRRFADLAGGRPAGAAARTAEQDDERRARHGLGEACREHAAAFGGTGEAEAYARSLLAKIHKKDLDKATARQLWQTVFTLRNRARRKTAQDAQNGHGGGTLPVTGGGDLTGLSRRFPAGNGHQ